MDDLASCWPVDDLTEFPPQFPDVGGKTFVWVYDNKKEFRQFVTEITKCTGLWKAFQNYVIMKLSLVRD